jgi:hypothetical protein
MNVRTPIASPGHRVRVPRPEHRQGRASWPIDERARRRCTRARRSARRSPRSRYDTNGNKGVSFGLNNLQKIAEGERIDGRTRGRGRVRRRPQRGPGGDRIGPQLMALRTLGRKAVFALISLTIEVTPNEAKADAAAHRR